MADDRFLGRRIFRFVIGVELTGKDVLPKLLWLRKKDRGFIGKPIKCLMSTGILNSGPQG